MYQFGLFHWRQNGKDRLAPGYPCLPAVGFRIAQIWSSAQPGQDLSALSDRPDASKSEVGGNAKEAARVLMRAFSPGGEADTQMAAQLSSMEGLEGLGAAGSESGRKHWRWVPDLPLSWAQWSSGSFASQEGVVSGREPGVKTREGPGLIHSRNSHRARTVCQSPD